MPFQRFHPNANRLLQQESAGATRHRDKPPTHTVPLVVHFPLVKPRQVKHRQAS